MRKALVLRIRIVLLLMLLFATMLGVRLYFVQVVNGETYRLRAEHQYVRPTTALFDRGSIFFTAKDGTKVSAATLKNGFLVAINPREITDPAMQYNALVEFLPELEQDEFQQRASRDDPYEEIAHRVDESVGRSIARLDLPGVQVFRQRWRYYPGGELGAHAVGFVAFRGDELRGQYGLERMYDETLYRQSDGAYVNFFAEVFTQVAKTFFTKSKVVEGDVITSIEPSVQVFLEETLTEIVSRWSSDTAGGIILDPRTGDIFALGTAPAFDLNNFGDVDSASIFQNPLVESVFEMGSIVKPLTLAAGFDAGVVTPETTYIDRGEFSINGETIANFDGKARGRVDMREVLKQSLNTGAAFVERELGNERFREYLFSYGIGEKSGVDLPNDATGLIQNLDSPRDIEYVTASFGQGFAVSPMSITKALTALANSGKTVTPHLVQKIETNAGVPRVLADSTEREVLSAEAADTISRMLVSVVDDALLGGTVALPRYSIAAKTGTAQIASPEGGYYDDRFLHSFFGYFPAFEPRFLVFLYNKEPIGARYSSQTLTEPFMDIVQFLINYYEIPPDR